MRKLLHGWYGYLLIRLTGYSPERFLNLCKSTGIEIWELRYCQGACQCYMTVKGFRACRPLARKAKVRLKILKRVGLPFFLYRNRNRKLFFCGFATFFLLLYFMSLFIWDINFEGNYHYTSDTLTAYLESVNIHYGMMKSGISCEDLEAGMRNQFPEITWVSARVSGTRLLVKIKENDVLSAIPVQDETPCDLIASEAGQITHMIVRSGTAQVSVGDEVEQGQLLVSGEIPIKNDSGEVIQTHYVSADADIYAQTTHQYRQTIPVLKRVQAKTGRKKGGLFIKVFHHSSIWMLPSGKEETWNYVMEEQQFKIFSDFYLPVYAGIIQGEEYVEYERFYTKEEKNILAETVQQQFLKNLMEKGVQIIENDVKILNSETDFRIEAKAVTEEQIGKSRTIIKPEETIEPDERSGDYH